MANNTMGSEVAVGYVCKPVHVDPQKPMMHYKAIIHICSDKRCNAAKEGLDVTQIRDIVKEMNLDKGESRIKISRAMCYGACRYKKVAVMFSNTRANGILEHNNLWLRHTDRYTKEDWKRLFGLIRENQPCEGFESIDMEIF